MIYFVYDGKQRVAETDTIEVVNTIVRSHPEFKVQDALSGKWFEIDRKSQAGTLTAASG